MISSWRHENVQRSKQQTNNKQNTDTLGQMPILIMPLLFATVSLNIFSTYLIQINRELILSSILTIKKRKKNNIIKTNNNCTLQTFLKWISTNFSIQTLLKSNA